MNDDERQLNDEGKPLIELKGNNAITNDPCALCGSRCDPTGFDFFLTGTWYLVCDRCAELHAPELVLAQKARLDADDAQRRR